MKKLGRTISTHIQRERASHLVPKKTQFMKDAPTPTHTRRERLVAASSCGGHRLSLIEGVGWATVRSDEEEEEEEEET